MNVRVAFARLACATLLLPAHAISAQQTPPKGEEAVFEIRIGGLAPFVTTVALDSTGAVLIPVDIILRAAAIALPADRTAQYMSSVQLAELLHARVKVDAANLVITIERAIPFPAEREAARLAMNQRNARNNGRDGRALRWIPRTGGGVLEWRTVVAPSGSGTAVFGHGRAGLAIAGGDLTLNGYGQRDGLGRPRTWGDWSYSFVRPASRFLRQIRVGDLLNSSIFGPSLHGISISNRLPFRHGYFGDIEFMPEIPDAWAYDIYRNGQLVGYADGASASRATILPLQYGATPLQLRAYSPLGEILIKPLMLLVPSSQLRRGRIEYETVVGRCARNDCRRIAYLTMDAGVSNSLTVGGGGELLTDSADTRVTPVLRASYASISGWQLQGDYQPAVLERARLAYSGAAPISFSIEGGRVYQRIDQLYTVSETNNRWFAGTTLSARTPAVFVSGRIEGDSIGVLSWNTGVERVMSGSSIGLFYTRYPLSDVYSATLRTTLVQPWRRGILRSIPVISAGVGIGERNNEFVDVSATAQLRSGTLSVSGRAFPRAFERSVLLLSYAVSLRAARIAVQANASARSSTMFDIKGGFAVAFTEAAFVDANMTVGTAGASGRAYYDEDGSGTFSAGDRVAEDVDVFASGQHSTTDAQGRFQLWGIPAYEPIDLRVDSVAGVDPAYSIYPDSALARATPNIFNRVDLRLVRVHEVTGAVTVNGVGGPGGISLILEPTASGHAYETRTFADGSFFFDRVFPGTYRLRVADASLEALGGSAESRAVAVPSSSTAGIDIVVR